MKLYRQKEKAMMLWTLAAIDLENACLISVIIMRGKDVTKLFV